MNDVTPIFQFFYSPSISLSPQLSLENHPKLTFLYQPLSPSGLKSSMDAPCFTIVPASWIAKVVVQDLESPVTLQFATKKRH